jgi:hypothetical protein
MAALYCGGLSSPLRALLSGKERRPANAASGWIVELSLGDDDGVAAGGTTTPNAAKQAIEEIEPAGRQ